MILKEFEYFNKRLNKYTKFEEYEEDINIFYQFYMEKCPDFENKKLIILEFLTKDLRESAKHFINEVTRESNFVVESG